MSLGRAGEGGSIFGLGHVHWGRDVVSEAAVLIEVDDQQTAKSGLVSY